MSVSEVKKEKDLAYYLTLFKVEGHTTWRAFMGPRPDSFELMWSQNKEGESPKITDKMVMRIDRITGTFSTA